VRNEDKIKGDRYGIDTGRHAKAWRGEIRRTKSGKNRQWQEIPAAAFQLCGGPEIAAFDGIDSAGLQLGAPQIPCHVLRSKIPGL
jgi:hypothetical protein